MGAKSVVVSIFCGLYVGNAMVKCIVSEKFSEHRREQSQWQKLFSPKKSHFHDPPVPKRQLKTRQRRAAAIDRSSSAFGPCMAHWSPF
jgi:hypothetical protein